MGGIMRDNNVGHDYCEMKMKNRQIVFESSECLMVIWVKRIQLLMHSKKQNTTITVYMTKKKRNPKIRPSKFVQDFVSK